MNSTITLATLRQRAEEGDRFAREALRCYKTDAQLAAAMRLAKNQDLTDGGYYVNADGRPVR